MSQSTPKYKILTEPFFIQKIRTERFRTLKWSLEEQVLKDRPKHVRDFFKQTQVPFRLLCETKFKRSLFGIFLNRHNKSEVQNYFLNDNKLAMLDYDLKTYSENELQHMECENNFAPDLRKLLERAVDEREVIDYDFLYDNIYALRFCDTPLTFIDSELLKFRHLKVLILCGNWLTDISGANLPKSLEYIELFANQIEYIHNLTKKTPPRLIHIGLRRNWLTNDSQLHLFGNRRKFYYLQSLDLSENDIYELKDVLQPLSELKTLMCLQLQGNPCSVVDNYKDEVLRHIPGLVQLDLTEILDKDREIPEEELKSSDAGIIFTCHRVMGFPKPPKQKGIENWFYFAIGMPLIEDIIEMEDDEEIRGEEEMSIKTDVAKQPKTAAGGKNADIYAAPDEYADECRRAPDTAFCTERFAWEPIMQLPEEALIIKSAEQNFADIRDTLRSSVCVRLIYLEVIPPETKKPKKIKFQDNTTKNKKNKVKNDGSKSSTKQSISQASTLKTEDPKETIVKKITLAKFFCDLHSINWSDKTIDFIWADQERFKNQALEVEGSLRELNYSDKTKPPSAKSKKGKGKSSVASTADDTTKEQQEKHQIPKIPTIQIGFGLQRSYYQS